MTSNESGNRHSIIGITMGDPAGIGPEITLKALAGLSRRHYRIIGSMRVLRQEQRNLRTDIDLNTLVLDTGSLGRYAFGCPQKQSGQAAFEYLRTGVELLNTGEIDALVTAPVSKEALRLAGFKWPGQTEFLAEWLGAKRYAMLAWTRKFKAVFVTIHLPLVRVARYITADAVVEKTALLDEFLRLEGSPGPRIGVMALNPHGGEFSLGEEARIADGVRRARRRGIDVAGPFPADTLVGRAGFNGLVAMYHDQAMIPAKLAGSGVNVTLGLGRIRTSPLHGTAFDIAGREQARPDSMIAAIRLARHLTR